MPSASIRLANERRRSNGRRSGSPHRLTLAANTARASWESHGRARCRHPRARPLGRRECPQGGPAAIGVRYRPVRTRSSWPRPRRGCWPLTPLGRIGCAREDGRYPSASHQQTSGFRPWDDRPYASPSYRCSTHSVRHPDRDRRKAHELTSLLLCVTPHPIHKHVASGAEHCRRVCRTVITDVETEGLKAAQVVHLVVGDQVAVPVH